MAKTDPKLIAEARELRVISRMSNHEISIATGIPAGTLSPYLSDIPLNPHEVKAKQNAGRAKGRTTLAETRPAKRNVCPISPHYNHEHRSALSTNQKCVVSELAVRMRLSALGLISLVPDVPGLRYDIVAHDIYSNQFTRIQIKSAHWGKTGRPVINVAPRKSSGFAPYDPNDYDILIAYVAINDLYYVLTSNDVESRRSGANLTLRDDDQNAWHRLTPP